MVKTKFIVSFILLTQLIISKNLFAATVTVYGLEAMPYCGVINGKPTGIAVDILNKATEYGAPNFKFIFDIPWIRATMNVETSNGELVAIIPFTRSSVRENKFSWVAEILATDYRFYTYGRDSSVKTIDEISDEVIGVVHGHAIIPMLEKRGLLVDSGAKNARINAIKLLNHRFNVMADSDIIAMYSWKQIGQSTKELQEGPTIGETKRVYIATGLKFPEEVSKSISNAVQHMKENGELQKIYDKWL